MRRFSTEMITSTRSQRQRSREWNEFWYWLEGDLPARPPLVDLIDRVRREQYTLMDRVTWKVKKSSSVPASHRPGQRGIDRQRLNHSFTSSSLGCSRLNPRIPAPGCHCRHFLPHSQQQRCRRGRLRRCGRKPLERPTSSRNRH